MPHVYSKNDSGSYVRHGFPLAELLTSDRKFLLDGIRLLERNSPEWRGYVEDWRKRLEKMEFSQEQIEEKMRKIEDVTVASTAFCGMKYDLGGYGQDTADGCPYRNFVCDRSLNRIGNILVQEKRVIILPYNNPKTGDPYRNLFYDQVKAVEHGHFYYDGGMRDALSELVENDFTLHVARMPAGIDDMKKTVGKRSWLRFIVEEENVPLDRVFTG